MKLRNTPFLALVGLIYSSLIYGVEPKHDVRSYDYGRYNINEYRDRGQVDRVEIKRPSGRGYYLRNRDSIHSQDQQDQNLDFPTIEIRRW